MIILISLLLTIALATIFENQFSSSIRYFRKLLGKEFIKEFTCDENGIDQLDVGTINGIFYGKQYHPVFLAHKALKFEDIDNQDKEKFLKIADWFIANIKAENNFFLLYNYPYPKIGMQAPWFSAMAQGRALEVLTLAYDITKENRYLASANNILKSLSISTEEGGATCKSEAGWWYEEYPRKIATQPRVLNGMMYTLMGLIKYKEIIKNNKADELISKGLLALENNLPRYDRKGDSYYDALGTITGGDYHQTHIKQLKLLYNFSGKNIFDQYAKKWENFDNQTFSVRLIRKPSKINLSVFIFAFIISTILLLFIKILR
ncbi:MAG: D-glucuronyl C5-epimerase family protein [Candidatus Cloacimonadales bacterium]